ncbi:hypothetical protein BBJ28_00000206 [Nothophytophthora sp. Chile5]|nr:hypothetical protein BBJ28_00000206 [Nothophytophthora sp. Chile5]
MAPAARQSHFGIRGVEYTTSSYERPRFTERGSGGAGDDGVPRVACDVRRELVKRGWVAPFLLHLHQMLRRENPKIIRWAEDGLAFQILDKESMTNQILPKYFKNKNFSSFQRQLNYFGFRKWSKARSHFPTYSREHFTRDNYGAMSLVKRQSKKSRKRKDAPSTSSSSSSSSNSSCQEQPAKRAATQSAYWIASDKCKPILPRPDGTPESSPAAAPVEVDAPVEAFHLPRMSIPMMNSSVFSLPVISPTRKVNGGYKLPSIRELSLSGALSRSPIGPIRPRLLA